MTATLRIGDSLLIPSGNDAPSISAARRRSVEKPSRHGSTLHDADAPGVGVCRRRFLLLGRHRFTEDHLGKMVQIVLPNFEIVLAARNDGVNVRNLVLIEHLVD